MDSVSRLAIVSRMEVMRSREGSLAAALVAACASLPVPGINPYATA